MRRIAKGKGDVSGQEMARATVGSSIMMLGYMMAQAGMLTGSGPKDKDERDQKYATGWRPYSILIGDTYYNFDRIEPLGALFGLAADFQKSGKSDQGTLSKMWYSVRRNVMSKTFLQGIRELDEVMFGDSGKELSDIAKSMGGGSIPLSSLLASIARGIDPVLRETKTGEGFMADYGAYMKSRLPGLSQDLLPRVNVFGEEAKRAGSTVSRIVSPVKGGKNTGNWLATEMDKQGISIHAPSASINGMKMSKEDYVDYVKEVGASVLTRDRAKILRILKHPRYDAEREAEESICHILRGER